MGGENPSETRCRVNKISGGFRNVRLKPQHPARAALVLPKKSLKLCYSFRGKLTYGLYWWMFISKTNQERLCRFWRIGIRLAAGLEDSSPLDDFCKALAIPKLDEFIIFLLTKRQFCKNDDDDDFDDNSKQTNENKTKYNLRPRNSKEYESPNLLTKPRLLVNWLRDQVRLRPKRSPTGLLRVKMFGHKPHPDTDIRELIKLANRKNTFFMSTQETLTR